MSFGYHAISANIVKTRGWVTGQNVVICRYFSYAIVYNAKKVNIALQRNLLYCTLANFGSVIHIYRVFQEE
jgi:hypothetical protein